MSLADGARSPDAVRLAPFSLGFRPFFLGAALFALLAMVQWLLLLSGRATLVSAFDPVGWHAHEFLFGYLGAVIAGFLLTAVPNWTGRPPLAGWPLGGLFLLWLAGRVAVALSAHASPLALALADLSLPVVLGVVVARELLAGRNWRNLVVLALLAAFAAGNVLFHWDAAHGGNPAQGPGLRLGLAAAMMMIALIGGRIVPSFTRNWLLSHGPGRLPAEPMRPFDRMALLALLVALVLWVVEPRGSAAGLALGLAGVLHAIRLARWAFERTAAEPLVWVLHAGYAFLPLGALALAAAVLLPGGPGVAAAQHLWMAGAIGLMTLAVMTRATLGHTGRALHAGPATVAIYGLLVVAVFARIAAGAAPAAAGELHVLAGLAWVGAYGGFVGVYGPMLLTQRRGG